MSYITRETNRQDIKCLYDELLKKATKEQKEKMYIAATAYLLGVQNRPNEKSA